ncbi:cytidylyltransferase domain-containing protein [Salegentibacter sp. Hel_I_6]|uniref:acylneuraminate cytidylyltransferase family protein n=1 Tax=Salegentibacter sp. Hel_I_6 TaxID=1250278 RepID=UPI00055D9464|nr:hypothetical protein [Salegentibacter sp. Hel_I_6]
MKYSIFIPVRSGSQRVIKKNTRDFAGIEGGLLSLKLAQLTKLPENFEIVISTNDAKCFEITKSFQDKLKNLKLIKRSDELCRSSTPLIELIKHAGTVCAGDFILWSHVTSPFCDTENYKTAINQYEKSLSENYDSLVSGRDYKEFLFDKNSGKIVNNTTGLDWPRTQDLPDWFEINNAIFLTSRQNFLEGNRIGTHPMLLSQNKIVSFDIDYEEDFTIAEAIYDRFYR